MTTRQPHLITIPPQIGNLPMPKRRHACAVRHVSTGVLADRTGSLLTPGTSPANAPLPVGLCFCSCGSYRHGDGPWQNRNARRRSAPQVLRWRRTPGAQQVSP